MNNRDIFRYSDYTEVTYTWKQKENEFSFCVSLVFFVTLRPQ